MSIFRILVCCLLIFICGFSPRSFAAGPLTVTLYLPDNFDANHQQIPNNQKLTDLFDYFENEAKLKFVIVNLPWKRAQLEVLKGNGILYGFSKSEERLAQYDFSLPVMTLSVWAVTYGEANSHFSAVKDLQGKILASGLGLSHGIEYERAKNKIFTVQEDFFSDAERFKKLVRKRSDFMLVPSNQYVSREQVDFTVNQILVPTFKDPELNDSHFDVSVKPMFYDSIHFASAKDRLREVIDRINMAIQKGLKNGSLPKLIKQYQ
jgi:ABC-type amino acid transport substrate-binding protein